MTETFFIDSSFFFALVDKRNQVHPQVKKLIQKLPPSHVTSNYIFAESLSLITKRLGKDIGILFAKGLKTSATIDVVSLETSQEQKALETYTKYRDKDFDYIDATSFVLCQELGIQKVLTFDHHFAQMGFVCVTID